MPRKRTAASLPSYRAVPTGERVEAVHSQIVAAAIHAFRVRGYDATTMSTVAAIAGVSPRTLYRHFGSKSDLFVATIEEVNTKFLQQLSERIHTSPLREAIIGAIAYTDLELIGESREMMRLAAADAKAWRHFLGVTSLMQHTVAAALREAANRGQADQWVEPLVWEVRASALLGAIGTAYQQWATTPDSELLGLITVAVDAVLPAIASDTTTANRQSQTGAE